MKGDASTCELVAPKDLAHALAILGGEPGSFRPFAGGTDLMVLLAAGKLTHGRFVSLHTLRELRGVKVDPDQVTLGALTTYSDVQAHDVLRAEFPMLCQAGSETGGVAIQNRGTLGGNIANASPAADSPPALLAYGAELELLSTRGSRWVPYDAFHTGYKQMLLAPGEIVARIRLPRAQGDAGARVHFYRKVGPRKAQAISKVCFAGFAGGGVVRIALGGVAPIVMRCKRTEAAVLDLAEAKRALATEIAPIDDVRSNARYRGKVAENLLVDFALRVRKIAG